MLRDPNRHETILQRFDGVILAHGPAGTIIEMSVREVCAEGGFGMEHALYPEILHYNGALGLFYRRILPYKIIFWKGKKRWGFDKSIWIKNP